MAGGTLFRAHDAKLVVSVRQPKSKRYVAHSGSCSSRSSTPSQLDEEPAPNLRLLGWEEKVCLWLLGSRPGTYQ